MGSALKSLGLVLSLALMAVGCATSTIEKRREERSSTYTALTDEQRALVDQGQIKVGMTADAVYIAWGKPTQIITSQTSEGKTLTTWVYHGTTWQEHRYWSYGHHYPYSRHVYPMPTLSYDYIPQS